MRDFNKVSPTLWQSTRFRGLPSDDGRFLFLYLLTCPHNNSAGCFWLPDGYACHDVGWAQDEYNAALQSLLDADMVDHDAESETILVERWFRHNPPMNKSHRIGIVRQLEKVPSDRLRDKAYAALEEHESGSDTRNDTANRQPSDASQEQAAVVTAAHLRTGYMSGTRRR